MRILLVSRCGPIVAGLASALTLAGASHSAHAYAVLQASASVSPGNGTFAGGGITYSTISGSNGGTFSDGTGLGATANFSSTTLTGQNTSFANYRVNQMFGGLTTAAASTSADLAQGIIRFPASTSTPNPGFTGGGSANAQVTINDRLIFQIASGPAV